MELIETIDGLRKALDAERSLGRTVGLVATMGALHDGHLSLVHRAAAECDAVVVTIFVNPLQFGAGEDLEAYPRDLDGDAALAEAAGATHLFAPLVDEMVPATLATTVRVARVSEGMEGASRPGHFDGVATVVAKLFAVVGPSRAYFGEKDHQQLQVVRRMVIDLSFPVDVVACPTVREPDGLAFSSRNAYLSPGDRAAAPVLHRALLAGRDLVERGVSDPAALRQAVAGVVDDEPRAELDYSEAVQEDVRTWRLLVAARIGGTRLIDNVVAVAP